MVSVLAKLRAEWNAVLLSLSLPRAHPTSGSSEEAPLWLIKRHWSAPLWHAVGINLPFPLFLASSSCSSSSLHSFAAEFL